MAILSDRDIVKRVSSGELLIEPFEEKNLTPNGYDLSIGELYSSGVVYKVGDLIVAPQTWFAAATKERVKMSRDLCGQLWMRSTWIRRGLIASFGLVDAGFEGSLTFPAFNASQQPVKIGVGERFVQLVFQKLSSQVSNAYDERSGKYQGQRGVTLS
ncbi:MAG: dCTP deaminase [Thaumarchaeota archaeon]|nr:dCTP deaminase [Nitrososphaerota archaeon]